MKSFAKAVHSDDVNGSDLNFRLYKYISGVASVQTKGENFLGSDQSILMANTCDVFDAI